MTEDKDIAFFCAICGETSAGWPTGGLACPGSFLLPIVICPSCGPVHWEVMQMCREAVVRDLLN